MPAGAENNQVFRPSIESLMNKGVQVEVWRTQQVTEEDPMTNEAVTVYRKTGQKRWMDIHFTNEVMAMIEKRWGNSAVWHNSLIQSPFSTVLDTFVILTGNKPREWVSEIIVVTANEEYQLALQTAYLIALGASPEDLGKAIYPILGVGRAKDEAVKSMVETIQTQIQNLESIPGTISSVSGFVSTDQSNSSGESTSPSTDSSSTATSGSNGSTKNKTKRQPAAVAKNHPEKEPSRI